MKYLLLTLFFFPSFAFAAITFDAASQSTGVGNKTNTSWSHTVTGSNTCLVVGVGLEDSSGNNITPDYIEIASTTLTQAVRQTRTGGVFVSELWYTCSPPAGTNTIYVHFNEIASDGALGAVSFAGASALGATGANEGTGDSTVSITTTQDNSAIVDTHMRSACESPAAGQTERWSVTTGRCTEGATEIVTTAGSYTQNWTDVGAGAFVTVAVEITPSATAAGGPPSSDFFFFLFWGLGLAPFKKYA